jgi:hypothetical protein
MQITKSYIMEEARKYIQKTMGTMVHHWYSTYGTPPEVSYELLRNKKRTLWGWLNWSFGVRDEHKNLFN